MKTLKEFQNLKPEDPEFPNEYLQKYQIKPTLQILHYNVRYEFLDDYPAKMPDDFARDMILMYSDKGDVVFDACCGSGVVPRIANKLQRIGIGTDINPKAIELCRKQDPNGFYYVSDARNVEPTSKPRLILSSLPFGLNIAGDKNHYSENPKDISNSKSMEQFFNEAEKIIQNHYNILEPLGIMILDARDRSFKGNYYKTIFHFHQSALKAGFKTLGFYYYQLIPYRLLGHNNKETARPVPLIDSVDAMVMYKPANQVLQ